MFSKFCLMAAMKLHFLKYDYTEMSFLRKVHIKNMIGLVTIFLIFNFQEMFFFELIKVIFLTSLPSSLSTSLNLFSEKNSWGKFWPQNQFHLDWRINYKEIDNFLSSLFLACMNAFIICGLFNMFIKRN